MTPKMPVSWGLKIPANNQMFHRREANHLLRDKQSDNRFLLGKPLVHWRRWIVRWCNWPSKKRKMRILNSIVQRKIKSKQEARANNVWVLSIRGITRMRIFNLCCKKRHRKGLPLDSLVIPSETLWQQRKVKLKLFLNKWFIQPNEHQ